MFKGITNAAARPGLPLSPVAARRATTSSQASQVSPGRGTAVTPHASLAGSAGTAAIGQSHPAAGVGGGAGAGRRAALAVQLRKLAQRRPFTNSLRNVACQALARGHVPPSDLKQIADHIKSLGVPYDASVTGFAKPSGVADGNDRPTLLVSFDFDDNLFDSSNVMRDLAYDVLTDDHHWPQIQGKLGNIDKADLKQLLDKELLRDPSPFHGLPSLSTGLAQKVGIEDPKGFYESLIDRYADYCKEPERFGVVLGSKEFFSALETIRDKFDAQGVDVVYLIATNKERSVFATQFANMMAKGYIPTSLFDGAIAWDSQGTLDVYQESEAKKPSPQFIYNGFNSHRTPLSMQRVAYANQDSMAYIHVGDSPSSDARLARNIKKDNPDLDVTAIVTNTTGGAADPSKLTDHVREAVAAGVHVQVTSHQVARARGQNGSSINDQLRDAGALVKQSPSRFDHRVPHPEGDLVAQSRVEGTIETAAKELADRKVAALRAAAPKAAAIVQFDVDPDVYGPQAGQL